MPRQTSRPLGKAAARPGQVGDDVQPLAAVVTRSAVMHRGRLTWVDEGPAGDPTVIAALWDRVVVGG